MSEPSYDLERLISRHLDDECTSEQQREFNARLRRDPESAALFEEHRALDREVKHALRAAIGGSPARHRPTSFWERAARGFALAAAACLAVMFWFSPARDASSPGTRASVQPRSWFASPPTTGDTLIERPQRFVRPQIRVNRPDTSWIVIPSEKPREFLIVEVNRVTTRTVRVQRDF